MLTRNLVLTDDQLAQIQSLLMNSFKEGLRRETNPVSPVKMFPTYVWDVPDGKEKYGIVDKTFAETITFDHKNLLTVEGKFLALDLGGTNFRVLLIELVGEELHHETEIFSVPQHLREGTGQEVCFSLFWLV